jgi:hypothetical protein
LLARDHSRDDKDEKSDERYDVVTQPLGEKEDERQKDDAQNQNLIEGHGGSFCESQRFFKPAASRIMRPAMKPRANVATKTKAREPSMRQKRKRS